MRPDELVELFDPVGAAVSHGFTAIILHGNGQDDRDGNAEFFAYLEKQQIGAAGRAADPGYRARGLLLFRRDRFAHPVLGLVDAGLRVWKRGGDRPTASARCPVTTRMRSRAAGRLGGLAATKSAAVSPRASNAARQFSGKSPSRSKMATWAPSEAIEKLLPPAFRAAA